MLVSPTPTTEDYDNLRQRLLEGMEEGTHAPVINTNIVSIAPKKDEEDDNDEVEKKNDKGLFFVALGMVSVIFYPILVRLYMMKISSKNMDPTTDFQTFFIFISSVGSYLLTFFILLVIFNIIKRSSGRNTFENFYYFAIGSGIGASMIFVILECMVGLFQNTLLEFLKITLIGLVGLYLLVTATKDLHQEDLIAPLID